MIHAVLVYGLLNGLQIAALSYAFTIVYLPTGVFYVGLAAIYSLSPYLAWSMAAANLSAAWAVFVAILAGAAFSSGLGRLLHEPLIRRDAPPSAHILASLGAYFVITESVVVVWQSESKQLLQGYGFVTELLGLQLSIAQLVAAVASAFLLAAILGILKLTRIGLIVRAASENPGQAELSGINLRLLSRLAFASSGFIAAWVSIAVASDRGFGPGSGMNALVSAVAAAFVAGRWSLWGPLVGGLVIGVVRAVAAWTLTPPWEEPATFAILALALAVRPGGLRRTTTRPEFQE